MIERVRNPNDRRTINIYLTDRARALKEELMPIAFDVNRVALAGVTPEEFETLRGLLKRVRDNLAAEFE